MTSFQFTHPGGVRPRAVVGDRLPLRFQFTHPGGVRPVLSVWTMWRYRFQFTHPGGVRLVSAFRAVKADRVSIHAPGRGATGYTYRYFQERGFNSRTREGCDKMDSSCHLTLRMFQFTHPGGVRPPRKVSIESRKGFQFTHPGGVRHTCRRALDSADGCFNSRTREGCDGYLLFELLLFLVSIHAPGRGATM